MPAVILTELQIKDLGNSLYLGLFFLISFSKLYDFHVVVFYFTTTIT